MIFFFNDTATTEIYTLSLHDALPISCCCPLPTISRRTSLRSRSCGWFRSDGIERSEEHTSELQSRRDLVCRLLLEKKKKTIKHRNKLTYSDYTSNRSFRRPKLTIIHI